ncbi:Gnk2-homologous domain [Dillenia turbinata]|uniref:Gnk2-homologous domain n=1 Tax=Dillenia turbinata TaxID=194707 RepID=A0AAN8V1R9_9MAGN
MYFSKFSFSLFLSLFLLLQVGVGVGVDPLSHSCTSSENFTPNGTYATNLSKLLGNLYFKTAATGFGVDMVGQYTQDQVNGLALCRGDVNATECQTCVAGASSEIGKLCPCNKGAIIWYDNCLLKYSDMDFIGKIDNQNKFYLVNVNNASDPTTFNQRTKRFLSYLSSEAYAAPKMYAAGELELGRSDNLYGLAQCTRDLSSSDCQKCLDDAMSEIPSCCEGKQGGRVVGGSCNIRYEIYPFFGFSLSLLSLSLLLQVGVGVGVDPLAYSCTSSENFTPNGTYASNLSKLLGNLYFKTPPTGFGVDMVGQYSQNQVNGLALCRGDVNATECQTCVAGASSEIGKLCPCNKGAIIWYDNCLLKYSDMDFIGKIDNQNKFYLVNVNNASDPTTFNQRTIRLLSYLSSEAYAAPQMYAAGELELGGSEKLYGLVQCTRDLSSSDCQKCLDDAVSEIPSCCEGKQGGRVVGGSCNIRYEIYPFFGDIHLVSKRQECSANQNELIGAKKRAVQQQD